MMIVGGILIVAAALPLLGFLYQWVGVRLDRWRLMEGRLVEIDGGCRLYLIEKGQGGLPVVFESGFGATSLNWVHIQDAICDDVHTVTYDRGGLGWSSPCRCARTPANMAAELREMLQKAGVEPPYVLVAHSFGGLVVRRYALEYPGEVSGLVLVDPMRTSEWPPVSHHQMALLRRGIRLTEFAVQFARWGAARLVVSSMLCGKAIISGFIGRISGDGGRHIINRISTEVGKMPAKVRRAVASHWGDPAYFTGVLQQLRALEASVAEMHDAAPVRGIPVTVLTPVSARPLSEDELRGIGDDVTQRMASKSRHWVHLDEPEMVTEAIFGLVKTRDEAMSAASD